MEQSQTTPGGVVRALHDSGVLILSNAWDAGSAARIARAGAKAIATTSGVSPGRLADPMGST